MNLKITDMTYREFCELYQGNENTVEIKSHSPVQAKEELVFLDCGGELVEWVKGIAAHMHTSGVSTSYDPDELFSAAYRVRTLSDQIDLVLIFSDQYEFYINVHKLPMWRLRFGETLWISDYTKMCRPRHEVQFTPDQQTFDAAKKFAELGAIAAIQAAQILEKSIEPELESESEPELKSKSDPAADKSDSELRIE